MVNNYRTFIKSAAHHLYYPFNALKGKTKKPCVLVWTPECGNSFESIKEVLAKATMLCHPQTDATLTITADASKIAIGAVLEQHGLLSWEPLGFFSAPNSKANKDNGPAFDRGLFASFQAIWHFCHMVEGRAFILYTNHDSRPVNPQKERTAHGTPDVPALVYR